MEDSYCNCDLSFLNKEFHYHPFRRIKSFKFCFYCGKPLDPDKCPLHKITFSNIKICGGIAGSEILGYSKECHICGFKLKE